MREHQDFLRKNKKQGSLYLIYRADSLSKLLIRVNFAHTFIEFSSLSTEDDTLRIDFDGFAPCFLDCWWGFVDIGNCGGTYFMRFEVA